MKITFCKAKKIKNSREEDSLEVEMSAGEFLAIASIPSGKSCGSKEAVALLADEAIKNVNEIIAPKIIDMEADVFEIDKILLKLDGAENKSNLGANALLGVSIATLKLSAKIANQPLWKHIYSLRGKASNKTGDNFCEFPRLFANVLNGGAHGNFNLSFQEYMFILGDGSNIVEPFNQLQILFEKLGEVLREKYGSVQMGDEGGYSPKMITAGIEGTKGIEEPFKILSHLEVEPPNDLFGGSTSKTSKWEVAIDVAASEFYKNGKYEVLGEKYSSGELLKIYENLIKKYPIVSIEDPFAENDFDRFAKITKKLGDKILIVGDDLTATNPKMIRKAILEKLINAVIVKPNQIGTVSEILEAIKVAREAGLKIIISHRSGETMDSFISDLAVGVGAYGIKAGAPSQLERIAKYERLIEIEKEVINSR